MEGILVSGTIRGRTEGECVRCLDPVEDEIETDVQELYVYPGRTPEGEDEDELRELVDDLIDLEPVLYDTLVPALPFQPVCRDDCPGLCSECGARLADDPGHTHESADPRWAALQELLTQNEQDGPGAEPEPRRADRGRPQAEDVPQQHAVPPLPVEGHGGHPDDPGRGRPGHLLAARTRPASSPTPPAPRCTLSTRAARSRTSERS